MGRVGGVLKTISSGTVETQSLLGPHSLYPSPLGSGRLHAFLPCLPNPPGRHPAQLLRDSFLPLSTLLPTAPWKRSCAFMCMGWGWGESCPLQTPVEPRRSVGTGCQPLVTTPAWLSPLGSAFVTFEADSPPPPTLQCSRLPVCHLLILFSGSRWPELSWVEYTSLFFSFFQSPIFPLTGNPHG